MLIALLRTPDVSTYAIVFGVAYAIGALIQQHYFRLTGFSEGGRTTAQMVMFSRAALMLPYILLVVFILIQASVVGSPLGRLDESPLPLITSQSDDCQFKAHLRGYFAPSHS